MSSAVQTTIAVLREETTITTIFEESPAAIEEPTITTEEATAMTTTTTDTVASPGPTPLGAVNPALRVSFKNLPIEPRSATPPINIDEDDRGHRRAATTPASTTTQDALAALRTQRIDPSRLDLRRRPNSFSGPIATQPRNAFRTLASGSHSVGTPRSESSSISGANHLVPVSEMEASPRKRETSVPKKTGSTSDLEIPRQLTRMLTRQKSEKEVRVGTPVKEGHANWMNVYAMVMGLRVAVSRCQAKNVRPITKADFPASHKMTFDTLGTELTPSSRYAFKFKDYAPWVFRCLRDIFGIDAADYLLSLTEKYVLSELGSPGKSGSFFYFTSDYKYIIKTIHKKEKNTFLNILLKYYEYYRTHPDSLITKILGLYRMKTQGGKKLHFVVMTNVFPADKDIHEIFDLKGSTVGREFPEELALLDPKAVLKDLNWLSRGRKLELGPVKREMFIKQLTIDTEWLVSVGIMDYSMLIGIHDMLRGNRDNIRDKTLAVYEPNPDASLSRQPTSASFMMSRQAGAGVGEGAAVGTSSIVSLSGATGPVARDVELQAAEGTELRREDETVPSERVGGIFYADEGGFRASDETNAPTDLLYYIGVIDIFTKYDLAKRVEHFWKGLSEDRTQISAVPPKLYGHRFLRFMKKCVRGFTSDTETEGVGPEGTAL